MTDDDVVEEIDSQELSCLRETVRDADVFGAWLRIAARVVVRNNDCRGVRQEGDLEDFPRVHEGRVKRPSTVLVPRNRAMLGRDAEHAEDFCRGGFEGPGLVIGGALKSPIVTSSRLTPDFEPSVS